MDNIFKKGDKYIYFKPNEEPEIGIIENIALSQVSDINGFCYEVINLITDKKKVLSLGQTTKGSIYKLNHIMTNDEIELFKKNKYKDPTPTRFE